MNLEQLVAFLDLRGGVVHARGLIVSDAAGIERLSLGIGDDHSSAIVLSGGAGGASIVVSAFEQRAAIDILDSDERARLRVGMNGEDLWVGLQDAKDEPRAGFLVKGRKAWVTLVREEEEGARSEVQRVVPGYL